MKLHNRPIPFLHKVAAREHGRYAMHQIHATRVPGADGSPDMMRCVATDGRVLAVVDVEAHPDDADGFIPLKAWEAACKVKFPKRADPTEYHALVANGSCKVQSMGETRDFPREFQGDATDFPRWQAVMVEKGRGKVRVAFNPAYLLALAEAIGMPVGVQAVTLEIQTKPDGTALVGAPIRVETRGGVGILMPVTIED